jgi:hypothetical protein
MEGPGALTALVTAPVQGSSRSGYNGGEHADVNPRTEEWSMQGTPLMMVLNVKCNDGEPSPLPGCLHALRRCLEENHVHYVGDPELVGDRILIEVDFDSEDSIVRFADLIPNFPLGSIELLPNESSGI